MTAGTGNPPRKLVHVERFPIFWGDMDALGHVNNVTYFRYMEQARVAWFETLVPPRRSSVRTLYEMRLAGDPHVYAEGSAVIVFIDGLTQRAIAIPPDVRAKLEAVLG